MVLALYPQTTCFYRALVDEPPTSVHEDYQLFFEDPSYPEGIAPSLAVPQRYLRGVFWDLARAGLQQCGEPLDFHYRAFASESHLLSDGVTRGCNVSLPVAKAPLFGLLSEHQFLPVVTTPEPSCDDFPPGPGAAPVIGRSLGSCLGKYLKCEQQCNETMGPIVRTKYSPIPLRTSPTAAGAVWLDPTIRSHQSGISQLNFVVHAWPLLVIILVSCAYAGVIAWLMERLKNPQEFPRPFLRGFWEGCWWAFITMTTVGYGDRSPKTICGRLFAFLWISFGLVITSMFTAGITTALGQSSQSFDDSKLFQANHSNQFLEALNPCRGKLKDRTALPASPTPPFTGPGRYLQMTVMNGSFEETLVYEVGSNPIAVNSLDELFGRQAWQHSGSEPPQDHPASSPPASANASDAAGVSHGNRAARHYGALIEHFMYLHMRQEHPLQVAGVKLQMVLKRPSVRGLLTRLRSSLTGCLINWLVTRQHRVLADLVGLQHQGSDASAGLGWPPLLPEPDRAMAAVRRIAITASVAAWGGAEMRFRVELLEFALHGLQRLGFGGLPADPRVLQGLGGSQPLGGVQLHQAGDQVAGVARNSVPPGWGVQLGAAGPHGTGKPCAVCSSCTASLSSKATKAARRLLSYTADCTQPFPCFCPRPSRLLESFCTGVQRSYLEIAVNDVLLVQVFQGLEQLADALGRILLRVVATTDDPAQCK
uniref:SGF29 C-terminal domain-containing protein n=1 Tax=Macrostomum lignano TaxID=282301 RepID=A0A1I8GUP9_9PLAT